MEELQNLTPLYNKEFYLAYLCGEDVVLPIPDGNTEHYLAYLCGMDVPIPDPLYRKEFYLAYKCGQDVELPDPLYRIEFYLAKWCGMDVEVPEPLYRIEYWLAQLANSGELKAVTGNPISVSDALAKPAESLSIEILPQQDLHGYSNPWPAGGGKNLFNINDAAAFNNKVTLTFGADGGLTVKNENGYSVAPLDSCVMHLPFGDYTISSATLPDRNVTIYGSDDGTTWAWMANGLTNSIQSRTVTIAKEYTILKWQVDANETATLPPIQLESGSTPTAWTPYENNCPITGWTGVNVQRTGKNLAGALEVGTFQEAKPAGSTYDYLKDLSSSRCRSIDLIPTYGQKVTISLSDYSVYAVCIAAFDKDGLYLGQSSGFTTWQYADYTFNNPSVYYIACAVRRISNAAITETDLASINLQVELGSTATDYEPYQGTTYSISWQDSASTVYGGELDVTSGVLTSVPYYGSYNGETLVGPWVSSMDKYVAGTTPTIGAQVVDMGGTGTNIQLSATDVELLEGNNTIWNDVGDMTLEYLADGPAEDIDALQILLGNRYVNNGGTDEATDREALDILLGGNTR